MKSKINRLEKLEKLDGDDLNAQSKAKIMQ